MCTLLENFSTPPQEFTQFPFWFWNDELTAEKIVADIQDFYAKGIYGFIIHPRLGLPDSIPYLGEKFLDMVEVALVEATRLKMKVILYDEGMYPSGSAHGQVVKSDPTLAAKGLALMTPSDYEQNSALIVAELGFIPAEKLATAVLPKGLDGSRGLYVTYAYSKGTIRGVHFGEDDGQENAPKASDLLNPRAVQTFIDCTHEVYYHRFQKYFGNTIIGAFTDEPSILGRNHRRYMIAWKLEYLEKLGLTPDGLEKLLPLFSQENSPLLAAYHDFLYEDLGQTYYGALGKWCQAHQINLMGHPQKGMDMSMLDYFGTPGQDMVWRFVAPEDGNALHGAESTSAKCSADSARHHGKRRNSNEIFGCCGSKDAPWDLTLGQMNWYLNWLFSRGVNLIIPHAFFYSLAGKRKEERPPDVGPHNLWWPEYEWLAGYTNRLSYLLTDSVNQTNIAVLCGKNFLPHDEVIPLYENQIEFNYLEKKLLFTAGDFVDGTYRLQAQNYRVLLVAPEVELTASEDAFLQERDVIVLSLTPELDLSALRQMAGLPKKIKGAHLANLRYSQFVKEDVKFELYFNEGLTPLAFTGDFSASDIWNLHTGTVKKYGNTTVKLAPGELILLSSPVAGEKLSRQKFPTHQIAAEISVAAPQLNLHELTNWAEIDPEFSGRVLYELTVNFAKAQVGELLLDLGQVADFCVVESVAGIAKQFLYREPYAVAVELAQPTTSLTLKIEVGNSLTNRYDHFPKVGGLLGPITVWQMEE